ncbi:MAG: hypothetical protein AB8B81_07940 [Halioglobus sp.]
MSIKQSKYLVNLNRLFILVLTLFGMFMDGFQGADLPMGLALAFWLWLPVCTELEERLVTFLEDRRQGSGAIGGGLSLDVKTARG